MKKLMELIQDGEGKLSATRVTMFLMGISGVISWQHAIWTAGTWIPSVTEVSIILASMGMKTIQKYFEK